MGISIKKTVGYVTGGLIALVAVAAIYLFYFKLGYIEVAPERTVHTPAVSAKVEIYRDTYGIPHIYGETTEDVFFGSGYTMAEDRLFQIEMTVRAATGRLAEVLGAGLLSSDKRALQMAYTQDELNAMIEGMPEDARRSFAHLVTGINHYVAEVLENPDEKMPIEFSQMGIPLKAYEPADIMAGISLVLRKFGASGGTELTNQAFLADMVERYGMETATIIFNDVLPLVDMDAYASVANWVQPKDAQAAANLRLTPFSKTGQQKLADYKAGEQAFAETLRDIGVMAGASRTIVVGADKSATGNPLMMQGTADGYEVHMVGPDFEFAGLGIRPIGMPVMGRGKGVGMLITTGERDTKDTFTVQLNPGNKYEYRYEGVWRKMDVLEYSIKVAGQEPAVEVFARTVHGPVMMWDEEAGVAHALKWALWGQEANIWAGAFKSLTAKTAADFKELLPTIASSNSNITYADAKGHIGFRHMGDIPARAPGVDPRLPAQGDGSENWIGFHPPEENPVKFDPAEGYSVAWNNNPAPGTVYGDGARWGKHFRIHMPVEYLKSKTKVSVEDLVAFNIDLSETFYSVDLSLTSSSFFKPYFEEAIAATNDTRLIEAARIMMDWDSIYRDADEDGYYDHAGAVLFPAWRKIALNTVFDDDISDWWRKLDEEIYIPYQTSLLIRAFEGEEAATPLKYDYFNGRSRADVMLDSLKATLDKLDAEQNAKDLSAWRQPVYWRYMSVSDGGKKGKIKMKPRRATTYSGAAVPFRYLPEAIVDHGQPDWIAVMEISEDTPYYLSAVPSGGQSWFINKDWKASSHINDQYELHRDGQFKKVFLDRETIISERESLLIIEPPL